MPKYFNYNNNNNKNNNKSLFQHVSIYKIYNKEQQCLDLENTKLAINASRNSPKTLKINKSPIGEINFRALYIILDTFYSGRLRFLSSLS